MIFPDSLRSLGFELRHQFSNKTPYLLPPLCTIPEGAFTMGSDPLIDILAKSDECPQHTLWLPTYNIGKYPVTVAEYAYAVEANATRVAKTDGMSMQSWKKQLAHPTNPIYDLTWYDALEYVRWLGRMTGQEWRLLTEAEWEKAARGTDGRLYPWGNQWDEAHANVRKGDGQLSNQATTSVDTYAYAASPYGVVDMVGNVEEWTSTIYNSAFHYPYNDTDGREAQEGSNEGSFRVLRGGCWLLRPTMARCASRDSFDIEDRFSWLHGLRIACSEIS